MQLPVAAPPPLAGQFHHVWGAAVGRTRSTLWNQEEELTGQAKDSHLPDPAKGLPGIAGKGDWSGTQEEAQYQQFLFLLLSCMNTEVKVMMQLNCCLPNLAVYEGRRNGSAQLLVLSQLALVLEAVLCDQRLGQTIQLRGFQSLTAHAESVKTPIPARVSIPPILSHSQVTILTCSGARSKARTPAPPSRCQTWEWWSTWRSTFRRRSAHMPDSDAANTIESSSSLSLHTKSRRATSIHLKGVAPIPALLP